MNSHRRNREGKTINHVMPFLAPNKLLSLKRACLFDAVVFAHTSLYITLCRNTRDYIHPERKFGHGNFIS